MSWNGFVIGDRGLNDLGDTHPDWMLAYADMGQYRIVGASAVGKLHLQKQLPRDDAFTIRSAGPWIAIGVSDGLGSRQFSRFGATTATEALVFYMLRPFVPKLLSSNQVVSSIQLGKHYPEVIPINPYPSGSSATNLKDKPNKNHIGGSMEWIKEQWQLYSHKRGKATPPIYTSEFYSQLKNQAGSIGYWSSILEVESGPVKGNTPFNSRREILPSLDPNQLINHLSDAFKKTHLYLRKQANSFNVDIRDIGCTGIGLLLNTETGQIAVGQVGDGACLGITYSNQIQELLEAEETEDLNRVSPLTSMDWESHYVKQTYDCVGQTLKPFRSIYVMTDGVSVDLLYSPDLEAFRNWVLVSEAQLSQAETSAHAAAELLEYFATYEVPGSRDDRTMVAIIGRNENADHGPAEY